MLPMSAPLLDGVPRTILVIDDDDGVTQTFARMLRIEGFDVHTASTAETGLRQVHHVKPHAIILDLRMPRVDGLNFLRRLRQQNSYGNTPVAVITGDYFIDDGAVDEIHRLGADVKFKPLWLDDLVELAHTLMK
jgi:DNA-binding NtrC family response regulator